MKALNPHVSEASVERIPWGALAGIVGCLSVFAVTLGLTLPLLSVILENRGVHAAVIGLNAAMTPVGLLVSAPLILPMIRRLGEWRLCLLCMALTAIGVLSFKLSANLAVWFFFRFVYGVAIGVLFTVSEAWITALAPAASRGRIVGLYGSVLSAGFAVGPFVLSVTGSGGWLPFLVAFAFVLLGSVPLTLTRRHLPPFNPEKGASITAFARAAPFLMIAVSVVAVFEASTMSLLPLYGMRHGLGEAMAAIAVGVLILGNVLLQPVIGGIADRRSARATMLGSIVVAMVAALLLPLSVATPWQWPVLMALGGGGFGIYTVTLIELGRRFRGTMLIAGVAAFSAAWGIGGITGPPLGGGAMEYYGPDAFPFMLATAFAALLLAIRFDR